MDTRLFFRQLTLMLVLVMGGTAPTWAWEYETSKTDGGGGNYTFRSEKRE